MTTPTRYASFLVRLWCEEDPERPGRLGDWQGEVEHIQSGRRSRFSTVDELLGFVRGLAEDPNVAVTVNRMSGTGSIKAL